MPREVTVVVDDRTIKCALTTNHLNRFFFSINSNNSRTIDAASYEPAVYNTFRFMMDELKTVEFMDVGANFGWFSNIVATSPLNRCLAIEIDKKFFRELVLCTNWNSSISPMYKGGIKRRIHYKTDIHFFIQRDRKGTYRRTRPLRPIRLLGQSR